MIGSPEMMKRVNINSIYQLLMEVRSATRQEITQRTKISLTTIRAILEEMLLEGQIVETALDDSSGGRRAQRYALNPSKNLILTFFFEENKAIYQIANLNHDVLETNTVTIDPTNITGFLESFFVKWDICAIGVGVPGIVEKGKFYTGCEKNSFTATDLGGIIQAKYPIPVVLENDLNAIAYGYASHYLKTHGECSQASVNLAYIHFNKACTGAGFIVDGEVLHGAAEFAGELGFMPMAPRLTLDQVMNTLDGFEECIDVISRTLSIINCVTNPALIVIGGNRFQTAPIHKKQLEVYLKQHYFPDRACPEIMLANCFQEDFLLGMKELTRNHIVQKLPLKTGR